MVNRSIVEAAKASLQVFSGEMSPIYRDSLAEINNQLLEAGDTLADVRAVRNETVTNEALLTAFNGLLPRSKFAKFPVTTPADVRRIQSTVIWDKPGFASAASAHYLFGAHIGRRSTKWLLADAAEQKHANIQLQRRTVRNGQAAKFTDRSLVGGYSSAEIEKIYDARTDTLQVGPNSPQSFAMHLDKFPIAVAVPVQTAELTNGMLAEYNVFDHLARLATVFEVEDAYSQLLDKVATDAAS